MHPVSSWRRWVLLVVLAVGLFGLSLLTGSTSTGPSDLVAALQDTADPTVQAVIFDLRLPRVLAAFGVGSALAVAGLLLQALFRNPLADPYVLGVSGGAAIGALLAMAPGPARSACKAPRWRARALAAIGAGLPAGPRGPAPTGCC